MGILINQLRDVKSLPLLLFFPSRTDTREAAEAMPSCCQSAQKAAPSLPQAGSSLETLCPPDKAYTRKTKEPIHKESGIKKRASHNATQRPAPQFSSEP